MQSQYENIRQEIRDSRIKEGNYQEAIYKCHQYMKLLNMLVYTEVETEMRFAIFEIALNYKKLNKIDLSIAYNNKAIKYTNKENMLDSKYTSSIWLLAECAALKQDFEKAIKLNLECVQRYRYVKEDKLKYCCIFNVAKHKKNTRRMELVKNHYETKKLKVTVKTHGDMDDVLYDMYKDICKLYIEQGKKEKAIETINKCKHKETRILLGKLLIA